MKILLLLAVAVPAIAFWPSSQDPATTDWAKEVERACTSQRYGMRLAAGRKVAKGGAFAVDAIRAYATTKGLAAVPASLVDAVADEGTEEPAVVQLLRDWSMQRDFYWRANAMRGLALRAERLTGESAKGLRELFVSFHDDAAWLMRTSARFGSSVLGDDKALALAAPESDPRAIVRLTAQKLLAGKPAPLQPLLDALADERTFQGDPWGARLGDEAHKALKAWLGDAHPLANGGSFPDVPTGIAALLGPLRTKSGQDLKAPLARRDAAVEFAGGIEVLSCKHGDFFLQWTATGELHFGIDATKSLALPASKWDALSKECTQLALDGVLGDVVCDSMRLRWSKPNLHAKVAPASLPPAVTNWLKTFAQAIEEAGELRLAAALRAGLEQFAAR